MLKVVLLDFSLASVTSDVVLRFEVYPHVLPAKDRRGERLDALGKMTRLGLFLHVCRCSGANIN